MQAVEHIKKSEPQFIPARDSRNRKIPGLYVRNGRFYGLLWCEAKEGGRKTARRFPLADSEGSPCTTLAQAKEAFDLLKAARHEKKLPDAGRKPCLEPWISEYLALQSSKAKMEGTQESESAALQRWGAFLGNVRVDKISTASIKQFIEARLKGLRLRLNGKARELKAASPRTVQIDCIALRNCLKAAIEFGYLKELPKFPKISVPPPARRHLLTPTEFEKLLSFCVAKTEEGIPITKNGEQLRDFLRFLAFTGAREKESLRVKWTHVDFEGERVFIGAPPDFEAGRASVGTGGTSKNRGSRSVDFNDQLAGLLSEMKSRRDPDSTWLFPSPQRGGKDIPAKSFRESFRLVRNAAGLPQVGGFHDLRHVFASFCVMAGIDFMTIAAWLGHKDGGILVGKTYGHLLGEHRKKMAAKLTIGLAVVPDSKLLQMVKLSR